MSELTTKLMVQNFAYHVSTLMTEEVKHAHTRENPKVLTFAIGHDVIKVEMWRRGGTFADSDPVWDGTRVNGIETGNRCGARDEFSRLFAQAMEAASEG